MFSWLSIIKPRQLVLLNIVFFLFSAARHSSIWFSKIFFLTYELPVVILYVLLGFHFCSIFVFLLTRRFQRYSLLLGTITLFALFTINPFLLQPFYFYYALVFLIFVFFYRRQDIFFGNVFLLTVCVYVLSAVQKINPFFFSEIVSFYLPGSPAVVMLVGVLVILFEALLPIALLIYKSTYTFLGFLLLNIGILLVAVFDSNIDITVVVWVLCMMINIFLLFSIQKRFVWKQSVLILILCCFGVLGYFGIFSSYMSFKVYSGNTNLAWISHSEDRFLIESWFYAKHNMYPPPHFFVYKKIFNAYCENNQQDKSSLVLDVFYKEDWVYQKNKFHRYFCN